jgi:hypothetical protein
MIELGLIPLGLIIAALFSMVGLAGGVFMVPMLVLLFGLPAQQAVGVSLFAVMFTTISATTAYMVQKRINYKVGLLLDTLDVPGAIFGAYLTTLITSMWLSGGFGILLIFIAAIMIWKKNSSKSLDLNHKFSSLSIRVIGYCLLGSFTSGLVSGMFGVGGGVIDEIVMILLLGMSIRISAGTAMFGMAITTVAAVIPHWFLGNIVLNYAIPLAIGCILGAQIGPYYSKRARASTLRKILGAVLVVIGLRMLLVPFVGV